MSEDPSQTRSPPGGLRFSATSRGRTESVSHEGRDTPTILPPFAASSSSSQSTNLPYNSQSSSSQAHQSANYGSSSSSSLAVNGNVRITKAKAIQSRLEDVSKGGEELNLSQMELDAIPPECFQFLHLKSLLVNSNRLQVIPQEIGRLSELRELSLECNSLVSLPHTISQLKSLDRLHAHSNELSSIPNEFCGLTSLTRLFLSSNKLTSLPSDIGMLTNLVWLSLDRNRLSSVPPEIARLRSLGWLSIESNELTHLPDEIGNMRSLQYLSIVNNPLIQQLPDTITFIQNLNNIRSDQTFKLPHDVASSRDGIAILSWLKAFVGRWDLEFDYKAHWVPDDKSNKCAKCSLSFSLVSKRRHHCRICGRLFCGKCCDVTSMDIPGIRSVQNRVCNICSEQIDLSIRYNKQREKTKQKELKKYGLRAGEDLLPTKEKIKRIEEQLRELVRDIEKERNTLDAMERMVLVYNTEATQRQVTEKVNEARQKIIDLNKTKTELFDLLSNLERELRQQE